jgi:hypothetical protein
MTAETESLARLSAGTLDWLTASLEFFDPYAPGAGPCAGRRAKAALELALLCHVWERRRPGDSRLSDVAGLIMATWERPGFQRLLAVPDPHYGRQYRLIYAALAPAGADGELRAAALARLAAEQHAAARGQSSYLRLETRYYADKAGLRHEIESYEELFEASFPAGRPAAGKEAYALAHASFYVSDFGFARPGRLAHHSRERAAGLIGGALDDAARADRWDLAAELVAAQFCLGGDPVSSPSGQRGIRCLARAQLSNGAIPGMSPAGRPATGATPAEFFQRAYHPTLVTAIMSLVISPAGTSHMTRSP